MPLEVTETIQGLVATNPTGADSTTEGNDHLQLLKVVLKNIFPGVADQGFAIPIVATEDELNFSQGLSGNIQIQIDGITGGTGLVEEIQDRIDGDTALQVNIDAEEASRIAADGVLTTADGVLQTNIDNEATTRGNADTTLQENIDTEAGVRSANDDALQDQIDQLSAGEGAFPAGTRQMFVQASAPLGWTQDVALDDRFIRVTSGVGNGIAGSDSPAGFNHLHTTQGHVLTIAEIPAHTHSQTNQGTESTDSAAGGSNTPLADSGITGSQGGGGSHTHGNVADATINLKYLNVIVCTKN